MQTHLFSHNLLDLVTIPPTEYMVQLQRSAKKQSAKRCLEIVYCTLVRIGVWGMMSQKRIKKKREAEFHVIWCRMRNRRIFTILTSTSRSIPSALSSPFRLFWCSSGNRNIQGSTHVSPTSAPAKPSHLNVFDRRTKLLQRERAARLETPLVYDYLRDEVGFVLADRIMDIKRDLKLILDLGCGKGHVLKYLHSSNVSSVVATDMSKAWLDLAIPPVDIPCEKIVMDDENITFEENTFNLVVSGLNLHWVNDLPSTFRKINQILKPDGVFLGAMFGSQSLYQLRCSFQLSELERKGGIGSHISPFAQIQDIGGLLNMTGFTMLTIDTQDIKISYPSIFELMEDLKGMGENNASWKRSLHLSRDTLFSAGAVYKEMYGNEDGSIPATFQIIYMIAWKPDPSQPKPLEQQKPDVSLKDLGKIK